MPNWTIRQTIDLENPAARGDRGPGQSEVLMVEGDCRAHVWEITVLRGGAAADLSGCTVAASFVRQDGETVAVNGAVSGNVASAVLAQECYAIRGALKGIFRIVSGSGDVVSTSVMHFMVQGGPTDQIIDPGEVIPSYEQVEAMYADMMAAKDDAEAAAVAGNAAAEAIIPYNAGDVLALWLKQNITTPSGITYAWQDANTCHVSGTNSSTTSAAGNIIWSKANQLPLLLTPGKTYRVTVKRVNAADVWFRVRWSTNGTSYGSDVWPVDGGALTVPSGAVGAQILLGVPVGKTVDGTITVGLLDGVTHDELNPNKGVLADAADLDEIVENGNYVMALSRTYKHTPWSTDDSPTAITAACVLEVVRGSDSVILQRITYGGTGGREYNRRTATGGWTDWNRGIIASELTGVNSRIDRLGASLMPYNAVDGVASCAHTDETGNNVTFHWIDSNTCEVSCTAAASASAYTWIYYNTTALPDGFAPGKTVQIKYSSSVDTSAQKVWLEVRMYPSGVWSSVRYYNADDIFKIPDNAVGMAYRLTVAKDLEPDETVTVAMITDSQTGRRLNGKYVAFGDSLTLGAVYSATAGGNLHYANREYRIPSRIARAVGAYESYTNMAVGGIGYTRQVDNQTLVDLITSQKTGFYDGVELVTVMAGANDKLTAAGTLDAIRAAISQIIAYFRENYPTIQLVFIQPLPSGLDATHDPWTGRGLGGWSLVDFDEAVSKLCYEAHVGYANWLGCTYCDTWAERNVGYNGSSVKNYTHPIVDEDYALIGDFIAGKVAQYGQNNKPLDNPGVKAYTTADMYAGSYWHFGKAYTYFNPFTGRRSTDQYYNCLWFPVKAGDVVRLRTVAGSNNAKPYALIGSDRLIYDLYTDGDSFDGEITIQQDGFVAINARNPETYEYYDFLCEVRTNATDELRKLDRINALPIQTERQQFLEYDDNDVCKVLVTGPSRMSMIHNWAIIGASFDSGEFNHALTVYPTVADYQAGTNGKTHWAEYEGYEYSCFEYLKRINGIPNMYLYSNGGQNSRDWIRYGLADRPARTWVYTTGELEVATPYWEDGHFWYISDDPDDPRGCTYHPGTETEPAYYTPGGNIAPYRTGAGHAGGNWWKLREDLEAGKRYNAYLINLGSNDLNNNHDFPGDPASEGPAYDAGTLADIGTYDRTTNTDTLPYESPDVVVPGIINSYAAYMGAILNRIFAYQPDAIVFVATIRNGFSQNNDRLTAWKAYNDVLEKIVGTATGGGKYYGKKLYLLDNAAFGPCYDVPPMNGMFVHNHPNALGYQYIAGYWNTLIDHAIQKNYLAMQQSMFIGTNMTGTV